MWNSDKKGSFAENLGDLILYCAEVGKIWWRKYNFDLNLYCWSWRKILWSVFCSFKKKESMNKIVNNIGSQKNKSQNKRPE